MTPKSERLKYTWERKGRTKLEDQTVMLCLWFEDRSKWVRCREVGTKRKHNSE